MTNTKKAVVADVPPNTTTTLPFTFSWAGNEYAMQITVFTDEARNIEIQTITGGTRLSLSQFLVSLNNGFERSQIIEKIKTDWINSLNN